MKKIFFFLVCFFFLVTSYAQRFREQSKDGKFYFADSKGNKIIKLGEWDEIEHFIKGGNGFTKVWKNQKEYYLDTIGNFYRVAYRLADLNPEIKALDLTEAWLDSFPTKILEHSQLEVVIFTLNIIKKIPAEINQMNNLKVFYPQYCYLEALPVEIGQLTSLTSLDLSCNELISLPTEIGQLKNLTNLDLRSNKLSFLPIEIGQLTN
jgi:Leucine-rich repeat (LRR) protein